MTLYLPLCIFGRLPRSRPKCPLELQFNQCSVGFDSWCSVYTCYQVGGCIELFYINITDRSLVVGISKASRIGLTHRQPLDRLSQVLSKDIATCCSVMKERHQSAKSEGHPNSKSQWWRCCGWTESKKPCMSTARTEHTLPSA